MKARIEKRAAQLRDKMRRLRALIQQERIKRLNRCNRIRSRKLPNSSARLRRNQHDRMRRFLRNKWYREAAKAFLIELLDRNKYVR